MPDSASDYRAMIEMPWGRMFYDLIFRQLKLPEKPCLRILDYGSGFGVAASHYARWHTVTAVEPNVEMLALRIAGQPYTQIEGGIECLPNVPEPFDLVLCHNVLEYADDPAHVVAELLRALRPGGLLSVVKHNLPGRAMAAAVLEDNPVKALQLISGEAEESDALFGRRNLYSDDELRLWTGGLSVVKQHGLRTFYALSRYNEVKFDDAWYAGMLALELAAGERPEYQAVSFFRHVVFRK